ncbi:MAG: hypothetical protein JRD89_05065 [Deltaproteobacteria bacterium]|nr:hypothetical protein [Deltaproteobacteria bacterium]
MQKSTASEAETRTSELEQIATAIRYVDEAKSLVRDADIRMRLSEISVELEERLSQS